MSVARTHLPTIDPPLVAFSSAHFEDSGNSFYPIMLSPMSNVFTWDCDLPPDLSGRVIDESRLSSSDQIDFGSLVFGLADLPPIWMEGLSNVLSDVGLPPLTSLLESGRLDAGVVRTLHAPVARFHVDHGFGNPGTLFVVTCVQCEGDVLFPTAGIRIPMRPGRSLAFDPLLTHGIAHRGESVFREGCGGSFLSVDIQMTFEDCERLGLVDIEGARNVLADEIVESTGLWSFQQPTLQASRQRIAA